MEKIQGPFETSRLTWPFHGIQYTRIIFIVLSFKKKKKYIY